VRSAAAGLLIGTALDALVPDPRRGHPVAVFGSAAGALERRWYADSRMRGVVFTAACAGAAVALGAALPDTTLTTVAATWAVLGGRSLRREAGRVRQLLDQGDLDAARQQVTHLVGRDPESLDADGIARATVESVAENTSDAIVAPLDDVVNLVPARLTAALVAVASRHPGQTLRIAVRDGHRHPSPNAGYAEAAYAGGLGLRLGGRNVYAGRVEHRPELGDGSPPGRDDIPRATRLCAAVTIAAALTAAAIARRC